MARAENVPVKTLPGLNELITGDLDLAEPDPPRPGGGPARPRAGRGRPRGDPLVPRRQDRARDRRRRLDRLRALPPDRPRRAAADRAGRPGRERPLRHRARARRRAPLLRACVPVLADVRDRSRMAQVFERYRPDVVFHAAAYKHVPLMEANPLESVRNNVLGTRNVADVAIAYGVERFVLISTDKALNPLQRLRPDEDALRVDRRLARRARRRADAASSPSASATCSTRPGSVIPLFRRQIERGGPVTVTDAEMTRFFMTIPEAVALVDPGRRDRRPRPHLRPRHGRADPHPRPRAQHDPALRARSPSATSQITFIGAGPARRSTRSCSPRARPGSRPSHPKIVALDVSPVDRALARGEAGRAGARSSRRARRSSSSAASPRSCASRSGWAQTRGGRRTTATPASETV